MCELTIKWEFDKPLHLQTNSYQAKSKLWAAWHFQLFVYTGCGYKKAYIWGKPSPWVCELRS